MVVLLFNKQFVKSTNLTTHFMMKQITFFKCQESNNKIAKGQSLIDLDLMDVSDYLRQLTANNKVELM